MVLSFILKFRFLVKGFVLISQAVMWFTYVDACCERLKNLPGEEQPVHSKLFLTVASMQQAKQEHE